MIEWIFWLVAALWMVESLAAAVNAGAWLRAMRGQDRQWGGVGREDQQSVALIVPVKGFDPDNTLRFFESILRQDYARYRLLLAVESEDDPVVPFLREEYGIRPDTAVNPGGATGLAEVRIVIAGPCVDSGQKIHNQRKAFELLEAEDRIVVFADADILCGPDWLARLTAPVNAGTHPLSTTYRWLIPKRSTWANCFASVINASVATAGRETWSILWGGSMAIARDDFDDLDVPGILEGSLNDDLRINKLARLAGRRVASIRSLMMPTPIDHNWSSFFEFANRQYYQVRIFSPVIYKCALFLTWVYTAGLVGAVLALAGDHGTIAWIPIAFAFICDQVRAVFRGRIYRALFDEKQAAALSKTAAVEHLATPLWMVMHCLLATSALFTREICWSGIRYRALSVDRTEILGRSEDA